MSTSSNTRTWFITGASTGFGRALTAHVLVKGERVVATARRPEAVADFVEAYPDLAMALQLDVTSPEQINDAVAQACDGFGRLDVVVNNAGYGLVGAIEEVTDAQIRAQFETNLFGTLGVTRAVIPHLRRQGSGHIIQISSVAGQATVPGLGIYSASKWAIEAFSEALAAELAPLGIKVTIIEPGAYRTDFVSRSLITATPMPEYDATSGKFQREYLQRDPSAYAHPAAAAQAIYQAVDGPTPPLRLALGADAVGVIRYALAARQEELEQWATASITLTATSS